VALGGSSFVARADDGDGWQLIASAGRPGKPGVRGSAVNQSLRGERGPPGLNIESRKLEPDRYLLTPILQGGHEGPPVKSACVFRGVP
jgi:hypothetical protein